MAPRRPAGFLVPLGFYDGPEVKSIPRRIRAAAVGVWALCGTFSANKLQDGYVGAETLKQLGCTDAIRHALEETRGPDGELDPLWIASRDGGIQFTKWVKYQRSRDEVKAYREQEAERKRRERNEPKPPMTSGDSEMSARTNSGVRSDLRDPKTKTETKTDIEDQKTCATALRDCPPRFAEFWSSYPLHRDRRNAEKAFTSALKRADPDTIIAGAVRYTADPNRDIQYTKYAQGWLNGDGWLDEPLPNRMSRINGNHVHVATSDLRVAQVQALKNRPEHRLEIE